MKARIYCLAAMTSVLMASVAFGQPGGLPAGPEHDLVTKTCTACHDAGMITGQHQTAAQWSDTVKQMISNGAQVAPADFDKIVGYLVKNFGTGAPATGAAAPATRSKNDVPIYSTLSWQRVEGKPIDTRWPEKQDDAPDFSGQTRAPYHATVPYKTTVITDKLARPWALQFLPDGKMLVTQRMGQLVIVDAKGAITNLSGVPDVVWEGGQGGLLDVALDPEFKSNHRIFFSYNEPAGPQKDVGRDGAQSRIVVGRATLDEPGTAIRDLKVIFRSRPAISVNLYPTKQGSRIAFDRDGTLFVTIGDRDSTRLQPPAWNVSQELSTHLGKIVHITQDGQPAPGNPFIGEDDALPEIWVTGTRSQEGLTFDNKGRLWEVEDGPRGGDELNIIERGKNYGWPVVTHGVDYPGWVVNMGATHHSGMVDPRYYWDPTIAPSGLTFYYGNLFPAWKGDLFVGGLRGALLDRLKISADDKIVEEEPLLTELNSRIRDVRVGPEGALYVLTDTNSLIKVTPK
jgi:glucose/arabinose dehydrogenase